MMKTIRFNKTANAADQVATTFYGDKHAIMDAINDGLTPHSAARAWCVQHQEEGVWHGDDHMPWVDDLERAIAVYERLIGEELHDA